MGNLGLELSEIRVVGGGAKSKLLCQIKADVTGLPVSRTRTEHTAALGAGILALVGIKEMTSTKEAVRQAVKVKDTFLPSPGGHSQYEEYYDLYRSTYSALLPVFDSMETHQASSRKPEK
jgi:sugar (pentulose or hexulose) kinase